MAIGIVGRPELLFLDEPTAGFDPQARREFHHLVHRLADLEQTSILLTTHDLDEAEKLADRILILADGRIVAQGSAEALARRVAARSRGALVAPGRDDSCTPPPTRRAFVRQLLAQEGDAVADLEVRRASLEDAYIDARARSRGRRSGARGSAVPGGDDARCTPSGSAYAAAGSSSSRACAARRIRGGTSSRSLGVLGYLYLRRDDVVAGTDLLVPSVALPSILGALIAFGVVVGPAYALAMAREDGTLLRYKALPHGLRGYFTGQLLFHSLGVVPQVILIVVPSLLLFDGVMAGGAGGLVDRGVGARPRACSRPCRSG